MCNSNISIYPEMILRTSSQDVDEVLSPKVQAVIEKLSKTMNDYSHCVGLAANQIGSELNIFVADASKNKFINSKYGFVVVVNPLLVESYGEVSSREGCMSIPDLTGNVARAQRAIFEGLDENGNMQTYEVEDFEARVFLHELDHLSGRVFLDRVNSSKEVFVRKSYS